MLYFLHKRKSMRKVLESCPSCGGKLEITEVRCASCETQVRSRYRLCDFCGLDDEQSTFLRIFVTSRGNLSEVEKRLGVSYPTVRAKLDEIIERLNAAEQAAPAPPDEGGLPPAAWPARRQILEAVARGEITAAEGTVRINELGGDHGADL